MGQKNKNVKQIYYKKELCPHLDFSGGHNNAKVAQYQVIQAITYRLKTGCQWRQLPMKQFFKVRYSWQSVYHHFQKWSKDGSWEKLWQHILNKYKHLLDMSSVQLDGTHTQVKRGGSAVAYQSRKKCKTSNLLLLTDSQGIPLVCSDPISGNHHDLYDIQDQVAKMLRHLQDSKISTKDLFLNADAGFDAQEFRAYCASEEIIANIPQNERNGCSENEYIFDDELYAHRFVIERTNAWVDAFKALLVRFETNQIHWKALNILAFIIIFLRKL